MGIHENKINEIDKNEKMGRESKKHSYYQDIEDNGLKYIEGQKRYLIFTAIFPIYAIIVQIFNIITSINKIPRPPGNPAGLPILEPRNIYDILTPTIIFLVISTFALMKFIFLFIWMKKVHKYEIQKKILEIDKKNEEIEKLRYSAPTLTQLFYDIVDHMQLIRIVFIILNIVFIFYLQWSVGFLLDFFGLITHPNPPPNNIFHLLNTIAEFGLIWYMVFEWKHFLKWNKKIQNLTQLEKQIYDELEDI